MESKFIPVRGNPSSPTKNTNYPFGVIGIFLCAEDGVEVYPRQGKSIFPHQKYQLPFWTVGIFYAFSRRERSGRALPSPRGEGAERSEADEVERSRPPPVSPVVPPNPTTPHPARRTAAPPSPQGESLKSPSLAPPLLRRFGRSRLYAPLTPPVRPAVRPAPGGTDRSRACQNSRHIPSARRARTATDTPRPTTAAAQNTPRIAASAFHPLSSAKLLCIRITFSISLYSLE